MGKAFRRLEISKFSWGLHRKPPCIIRAASIVAVRRAAANRNFYGSVSPLTNFSVPRRDALRERYPAQKSSHAERIKSSGQHRPDPDRHGRHDCRGPRQGRPSQGGRFRSGHDADPGPVANSGRHHGAVLGSLADARPQRRTPETIVNLVTPITVRPSALT